MPDHTEPCKIIQRNECSSQCYNFGVVGPGDSDCIFDDLLAQQEGIVGGRSKGQVAAEVLAGEQVGGLFR